LCEAGLKFCTGIVVNSSEEGIFTGAGNRISACMGKLSRCFKRVLAGGVH
jgi:hypothetical protein